MNEGKFPFTTPARLAGIGGSYLITPSSSVISCPSGN